ncbi:citrate/2-methylcitrate synthase [Pasteuria penetrans]|uniref:citrate/2-methylcitrate synthase n=1 Tax=Pasteuria penetrans TaxID=86005 RepID=UPI000FC2A264|nr:citrate/2-methylcitrate synthase [Pasteuria penetrans]
MTVKKGLEDVIALSSEISSIVDGVLTYRGYSIDDLVNHATFEEVAYLLWYERLPTSPELHALKEKLHEEAVLSEEIQQLLRSIPRDANPMAVMRTMVSALSLYDPQAEDISTAASLSKAVRLTAQFPLLLASYARLRAGHKPIPLPRNMGIARGFLYLLRGEEPPSVEVSALDKALVLHADHELNASTFAARVTAGTLADMHSAVVAALGALKGSLHGGANERVMAMLEEIGSPDRVGVFIEKRLERREKIMGFGHRVYRDGDPRVAYLCALSKELSERAGDKTWYEILVAIEELMNHRKNLKANVDFYSGSVYAYLGIPRDLFTPIFAMSRMVGWTAHILEQYADNRLIRPRAAYTGATDNTYVSIEKRV